MDKILVTGADGFLGKNLVKKLLQYGKSVIAIVYPGNDVYYDTENEKLKVVPLDISNLTSNVDIFPDDIDMLYHLAWAGVKPELRDNLDVQLSNLNMSLQCVEFAKRKGIKRILMPGSTTEYMYYGKPINEKAFPSPSNAYGAAKVATRYLCAESAAESNIDFLYAIVTGIYSADRKDNNVIYYTIDKLLHGERPSLTKLEQLWDYVYVDDVVDAFIEIGNKGRKGKIYAVGHGDNWALRNYIEIIHQKINPSLPLGIGDVPYKSELLPSSCIDLTALREDTGFEPKVDFEEGITRVIERVKKEMDV